MVKIAFFQVKNNWEKEKIKKSFPNEEVLIFEQPIEKTDYGMIKDIEVASVFIYSDCSRRMLEKLPNLKAIVTRSTGFDHIDLEYCKYKGISVCNVPHYGENTVAEFTFALLLAISRKIVQCYKRVKSGSFSFEGLKGFDLAHKKVGVIGAGNIGKHVIRIAKGFEMDILVYDKFPKSNEEFQREINYKNVDLDTLFRESDIITLHVPLTPETKHIINKGAFEKMKDGVIIINTARGDLIKSEDLVDALNSNKVAYAGLDVIEGETFIKDELELLHNKNSEENLKIALEDHILMTHNRVIITPHNAFNTQDALERILDTSIKNIKSYLYGDNNENRVI